MTAQIRSNVYGKAQVRVARIDRSGPAHIFRELVVQITLDGDFGAAHTAGDNRNVLPTDSMKNTVHAFAYEHLSGAVESFGRALARHFVESTPPVTAAYVAIDEVQWDRVRLDGADHPHAFTKRRGERATASVAYDGAEFETISGLSGLIVLKTTDSKFVGYLRDAYTTLPETHDRILGTDITATWTWASAPDDFDAARRAIRTALIHAFAEHDSPSVQATLNVMANAALDACPAISSITLSLPNLHYLPIDLSPFGIAENHDVFLPSFEPYGLIEATVSRG